MNWKLFIMGCVSTLLLSFPQNIIGCGAESDPYDYYISFFNQHLSESKVYKPFYYTSTYFLYDQDEPIEVSKIHAKEWSNYTANSVTEKDALQFVNKYALKDITNLYFHIEKKQPLKIPDSVKRNSMTNYFIKNVDLEALGYIMYAKQVEPYVYAASEWEAPVKDMAKTTKLIKNGTQLFNAAKKDIIKLKYAFQILRLSHYSGDYTSTIANYENLVSPLSSVTSILQPLCLSLKAGSLFRSGNHKLAAYLFSKAYAMADAKKISNYLGFNWSVKKGEDRTGYLNFCKTNEEKADMLTLFALNTPNNNYKTLDEVFTLHPSNNALEVLAIREINKIEERFFTPTLQKEKGIQHIYIDYSNNVDSTILQSKEDAKQLTKLLHKISQHSSVKNKALFETGAAYTSYILKDYAGAKNYLMAAKQMNPSTSVSDQWALTNLLITINEKDKIDAAFEEQILPSVQWLYNKAKNEQVIKTSNSWSDISPWKQFYRNLFNEIIAPMYRKQGDVYKETLAYGAADKMYTSSMWGNNGGVDFLRNKLDVASTEKLYSLLNGKQNKFEQFIIANNMVKLSTVVDFAATAYLREGQYTKAIEWLKKSPNSSPLQKNPFIDLLYDREEPLSIDKKTPSSKLLFAQEMLRLQELSKTDKVNAAKHLYKMALGMYNTTYYGHTWEIVQYNRSGSDGYYIPDNATPFEKEYYGCVNAHNTFKAAMEATSDKELKARCLFMMAKCSQKTVQQPKYFQYTNNWDAYDKAYANYLPTFKNNTYFPQFVSQYKDTKFYNEAFNSCSYLRDFVSKK
jgi:hypothetical protein